MLTNLTSYNFYNIYSIVCNCSPDLGFSTLHTPHKVKGALKYKSEYKIR